MSRTQFCYAMLLIAAISTTPAYCGFTGFYQLIPSGGDGTLRGGFVTLPAGAPSLVVDLPSTAKSTDNFHTIAVDGRASIYAGDERNFGVFAAASAVANPGAWTAQLFGMQTRAHISVIDDMRLTGNLSNAHFIRMQ